MCYGGQTKKENYFKSVYKMKMPKMPVIRQYNKFSKQKYKKIQRVEVEMLEKLII
jgi:ribosomal protein S17